ncbi:DUF4258 domain-containing protein [Planktosalinus lacus]|uniref:DUF4258 domain-containing protein n=1 Tax=Planktosalinus lacus TaxID=1526573 RepID=A0A8J2VAT4_9FLAO|nr:DUF4258 domain-containing protein [Planktosalinus lacus]GGD94356.1 hypothetical protein GCM10011312_17620 [Planktosalinus lacus]
MKFTQRLAFYLFGFSIGLIFLFFFLNKKGASCDYSPDARVKKNIRLKPKVYSERVLNDIQNNNIDTASVNLLLQTGDVDFGESDTKRDSCNLYVIYGKVLEKLVRLEVENCPENAVILSLSEKN